jgi:glycosyltransferase involved in cell wall biosynthesis
VIYDVHESFIDILAEADWIHKWAKPLVCAAWDKWECRLVRRCGGIVAVTETIGQRYRQMNSKVQVVSNYPVWDDINDLPPVQRDGITCVFSGAIRPACGITQILKALAILKERGLAVPMALAGGVVSDRFLASIWDEAEGLGVRGQIQYHGVLSKKDSLALQHKSSIGLVAYPPFRQNLASLPIKLMECMALGLPVVFSDFPNYRRIAETTGAGIMVNPTHPVEIADAIECLVHNPDLARRMGEAGKQAVREQFNWKEESRKLLHLYRELVGAPGGCMS